MHWEHLIISGIRCEQLGTNMNMTPIRIVIFILSVTVFIPLALTLVALGFFLLHHIQLSSTMFFQLSIATLVNSQYIIILINYSSCHLEIPL